MPSLVPLDSQGPRSFLTRHHPAAYLNKAHFKSVSTLELQRQGKRCIGLKITRYSDLVDVIGQWDPSNVENTSTLYQHHQGPLDALTFVYSFDQDPLNKFVQDILVGALVGEAESTFVWKSLGAVSQRLELW